jgi:hypothetical protein
MKQRPRIYYTDSQKALMWDRWRQGDPVQNIFRRLFRRLFIQVHDCGIICLGRLL